MLLKDQVALITGSGRGIRRAIAHLFAKEGAAVFLTARTEQELSATAAEITSKGGAQLTRPQACRWKPSARISLRRRRILLRDIGMPEVRIGQTDLVPVRSFLVHPRKYRQWSELRLEFAAWFRGGTLRTNVLGLATQLNRICLCVEKICLPDSGLLALPGLGSESLWSRREPIISDSSS